ncbi:helicase-like transcription factor [Fusarium pseudoanthophilum]|uniref:Helicase-like transcription factor n=1 Tax=Fusarium pseudoanthophilum TaxID=48495 RepID=A0A8H5L3W5_9HYPO|nr:helicase-like transcription factor [Fusarium pseudoanthophilum]
MDVDDQDMERAYKRIRLQSPEPGIICDNFEDFVLSDSELFPQLPSDNGSSASILKPTEENKDEARLDTEGEASVAETVHHVCLGTVTPKTASSFFKNRQESEVMVNIRQCGDILKLRTVDTDTYAGVLDGSVPPDLLHRPSVKLNALLTAPASLRVTILSHIDEATEIGSLLSNNQLFLQHPSPRDIEYFELEMEYFNPQFLVTPGSRMPQLEDLAIEYNEIISNASLALDDQKKGQLIGIFDTAADLPIQPTTEPSPRLQTRLKDYQLKALTFMSEKECANVESPQCPSLWVARDASNGKDRITGHRVDVPPVCAGGILADEMGLGKTLCVLSLICWSLDLLRDTKAEWNGSQPSTTLVVIPKSSKARGKSSRGSQLIVGVIPGWQAQIETHIVPGQIRVAVYHGPGRQTLAKQFRDNDIVLTTYQTLRSEWTKKGPLFTEQWFRVVLDESHRIGNRSTQVFQAACELQSSRRWCLTGTPIVNSIDNIGALLAFIKMEPLDTKATFDHWISNQIRDNLQEGLRKLRILVEATCLRRTKSRISQALPPPTVCEEKVELSPYDRALYDFFESEAAKNAADSPNNYPASAPEKGREKKNVLSLIQNLRQICDHGEDLLPATDIEVWSVVFSYWTKMLDLVQKALLQAGLLYERIDGRYSITQREKALSRFANDPCCTVMLATLGSGGEGIDLTSANHVHLLEPHWNPMAEEQAIARVHRMGQQRDVTATKYITTNSIEELIQDTWSVHNESSEIRIDNEISRRLEKWLARRSKV